MSSREDAAGRLASHRVLHPTRSPIEDRRDAQRLLARVLGDLEASGWDVEQYMPGQLAFIGCTIHLHGAEVAATAHHDHGGRPVAVSVPATRWLMLNAEVVAEITSWPERVVDLVNAAVQAAGVS